MRAIVFANGEIRDLQGAKELINPGDILIAADGGARFCREMDLIPDILIGDLDSVSKKDEDYFQKAGTKILKFEPRKDETDLELALLHSLSLEIEQIIILGGLGRRWDHSLANLLLPALPALDSLNISFWEEGQWIYLIRNEIEIKADRGSTLSLIPLGGDAEGVNTKWLEWPLIDETLVFGATRGLSNKVLQEKVSIKIKKGKLLCVYGAKD